MIRHIGRRFLTAAAVAALLGGGGLALHGCVERKLILRSEPTGARVVLNGDEVGMTPLETHFTTYGVYDVVLSAPNCARLRTTVEVKPPWYETLPLDFFFEHMWPFTLTDRHEFSLALKPSDVTDDHGVDEREKALRDRLRALPGSGSEAKP